MKSIIFILSSLFFSSMLIGQVNKVEIIPNKVVTVSGNLSEGKVIEDLSWAWSSSNACFPSTQKSKFTGNHVFYSVELPAYSEMEVTVTPEDKNQNFSIYAYQTGLNNADLVPDLPRCIRCEVDHKWDRQFRGRTQDHSRTAKDLVAITNPYRVVVAVVGADGLAEGDYTLSFSVKSR